MSELGKRVAVAVVGIPAVLGLVYLGGWFIAIPLSGFSAWGAHEIYRFAQAKGVNPIEWVGVPAAASFVLLAAWRPVFSDFSPFALGVVALVTVLSLLEAMRSRGPEGAPMAAAAVTLFGTLYAGLSLAFIPILRDLPSARSWDAGSGDALAGLLVVALPLVATWVGDAAAFFAGTAWGQAKLAPTISPNKSWVGFWADLAGGAVAAVAWLALAGPRLPGITGAGYLPIALVGALLGLAAVVGDLLESLLKREAGVKDSGSFFPGHGGVLDRIDSLVLTIPTAWVLLVLLSALA